MRAGALKRACAALLPAAAALGLAACGETVSTGSFKGQQGAVAQRISQFQSDASKSDETAMCRNDLAAHLRTRLGSSESACQQAIKEQLTQVEVFNLSIDSITVSGANAKAMVKSTYGGKTKPSMLTLVKEGAAWRISSID